ncbi:hypothetical protein BASA50_003253 [Batrachochytrium salamandrivorans]|uniref:Calponin-homology (CH) domain-containing protein n=1 Tax=Batrachochytrium salamandrivorans TaxID=1357716 RepID=A0ABQ8FIW8_9FUNG|nr:hypothetical protein BASA62_004195 [Batrachochytrium salamandrivorans]KAH6596034.1 hypothetical protein BASA61_003577 [Batrachochytrium salamandrivorans]KAH6599044.1 hypothetical protein BASA50_003253 [Batrachochytrium salamandrivorans]
MENNARYEIHATSQADPQFKRLLQSLKQWINSYTSQDSVVVRDIFELTLGRAVATLLERVTGEEIVSKGAFSTGTLKNYQLVMGLVVQFVDRQFGMTQIEGRWTLKGINAQDISSLLSFLVDLAILLRCPFPLPPSTSIAILKKEIIGGTEKTRTTLHELTGAVSTSSDLPSSPNGKAQTELMDSFDTLVDSPQKFQELSQLLLGFVNLNLAEIDTQVTDLSLLHDGMHMIRFIGLLSNFFVPLSKYHPKPTLDEQKSHNIKFGLELTQGLGINTTGINSDDIVQGNTTAICRWM